MRDAKHSVSPTILGPRHEDVVMATYARASYRNQARRTMLDSLSGLDVVLIFGTVAFS